jgi:CheY-like chemotaxis protein
VTTATSSTPTDGAADGEAAPAALRALVVDDEPVSRFAARRFLERLGYGVDEAADGPAAVKAARRQAYDLICLDCEMPQMDGMEAARQIRAAAAAAADAAQRVPIIALSAHTEWDIRQRCLEAGMDECLAKPLERGTFAQVMARLRPGQVLEEGRAVRPAASATTPADGSNQAEPAAAAPPPVLVADPDAPIDVAAIFARALNDPEFVVQLLERFQARADERLGQLVRVVEAGPAEAVAEEAHGLLGAARHLSARGLEQACRTMELAARAGDVRTAGACVPDVRRELRRCGEYVPRAVELLGPFRPRAKSA